MFRFLRFFTSHRPRTKISAWKRYRNVNVRPVLKISRPLAARKNVRSDINCERSRMQAWLCIPFSELIQQTQPCFASFPASTHVTVAWSLTRMSHAYALNHINIHHWPASLRGPSECPLVPTMQSLPHTIGAHSSNARPADMVTKPPRKIGPIKRLRLALSHWRSSARALLLLVRQVFTWEGLDQRELTEY